MISLTNCVVLFFRMLFRNVLYEKSRPWRSKRFTQYQDAARGKNYTVLFLTLVFIYVRQPTLYTLYIIPRSMYCIMYFFSTRENGLLSYCLFIKLPGFFSLLFFAFSLLSLSLCPSLDTQKRFNFVYFVSPNSAVLNQLE